MTVRFGKRLLFGTLLVGMLVLGLWWDAARERHGLRPIAAPLLITLFTVPAVKELIHILGLAGVPTPKRVLLVSAAVLMLGKAYIEFLGLEPRDAWFGAMLVGTVVVVSTFLILDRDIESGARRTAGSMFALALVVLQSTMIDLANDEGTAVLFALVLTSKAGDSGAYLVGKTLGRHKLIEHISPKKTIEGAIGGFVASLLVGVWLLGMYGGGRWSVGELLAISAVVNLAGQVGGFVNSLCKRAANVKDSGHLLPEFGGALDIVDSLFLAMPAGWALLAALRDGAG